MLLHIFRRSSINKTRDFKRNDTNNFAIMQTNQQKISPIKSRILLFISSLGISKRKFYTQTGISRGTLESSTGITEDILARFISIYPEINPLWLLKGEGSVVLNAISDTSYKLAPAIETKEKDVSCTQCASYKTQII